MLNFLYNTTPGRILLRLLTARWVSRLAGSFMDSPLSRPIIPGFVRKNSIDLEEYDGAPYRTFNSFFTRPVKAGLRPFDTSPDALCSPCDGLASAYRITDSTVIPAKQSRYTVADLVRDTALAGSFDEGTCLVLRLCVNHYHRYAYFDSGTKGENIFIPGRLHTVRPVALREVPVFTENCREYTVLHTDHAGDAVQIEVGAMLVGKIANAHGGGHKFSRGDEKGMFLYGGSTVILLLGKDVTVDQAIFDATDVGEETPVKMGQRIGTLPA